MIEGNSERETEFDECETDRYQLVIALRELEHAVNMNVSGMKVDMGEWLRLIHQAREALGHRVVTP